MPLTTLAILSGLLLGLAGMMLTAQIVDALRAADTPASGAIARTAGTITLLASLLIGLLFWESGSAQEVHFFSWVAGILAALGLLKARS